MHLRSYDMSKKSKLRKIHSQTLLSRTRWDYLITSRCPSIRDIRGKLKYFKDKWLGITNQFIHHIHFIRDITVRGIEVQL